MVKIQINKVDDINFIMSGEIENSIIEEKVAKLQEEAKNNPDADESNDEKIQQDAAGQAFKEFIDAGIKEAGIDVATLLGQPALKKYEQKESSIYFEVELATSPEIDVNIDLSDAIPAYTKPVPDPAAVEAKLEEFAKQQAPFAPIETPKAVEDGEPLPEGVLWLLLTG